MKLYITNSLKHLYRIFPICLTQDNERGNVDEVPSKAVPVKAASLVGSIIVSELKRKFGKKAELE